MSSIHRTLLLALIGACASTVLASAQAASSQTEIQGTSTPVAYIYVTSSPNGTTSEINGYSAASTGALSTISGSPFADNVTYIALNGKWLFGTDGTDIYSYSIGSNGSLKLVDTFNPGTGQGLVELFLDHTGTSLYTDYFTENNEYLAYSIDSSTGSLSYLDNIQGGPGYGYVLSFIGNNEFAYASSCYHFTPSIYGVQRASSGAITGLNINPSFPAEKSGGFYCPWSAAADPTNHVAIAMQPLTSNWGNDGPTQLATYTADSSGNLTTTSTYSNMPSVLVGTVYDFWMSPTGKYLAVGGSGGLQLFHFNGANPITKLTGLLTSNPVEEVFWDNSNHLYALSFEKGKLYVFTVTSTGVTQAPGSPHSITNPRSLMVLPK